MKSARRRAATPRRPAESEPAAVRQTPAPPLEPGASRSRQSASCARSSQALARHRRQRSRLNGGRWPHAARATRDRRRPHAHRPSSDAAISSRAAAAAARDVASCASTAAHVALADPVTQHVAPTRGAPVREPTPGAKPRAAIGGARAPRAQRRLRADARRAVALCRRRPALAQRRQHAMTQKVAIEAGVVVGGIFQPLQPLGARPLFELARVNSSSGRASQPRRRRAGRTASA